MWYYDWTIILVIPAALFALYAQGRVGSTFRRFSEVGNRNRLTGAEVARRLLMRAGITDVKVEKVAGNLTDHYDPRTKTLRLSEPVYDSESIAALGVAAHETGHAVQHDEGYMPLSIRSAIVPVATFGSTLAFPLVIAGFFLTSIIGASMSTLLINVGIVLFTAVVAFQLITLPVEFNASRRAIAMLDEGRILAEDEIAPARKMLNAAALTYVASAAVAIANLLRIILLSNRRR